MYCDTDWAEWLEIINNRFGTRFKTRKEMLQQFYWCDGMTMMEIAEMISISDTHLYKIFRKEKIPVRPKGNHRFIEPRFRKYPPEMFAKMKLTEVADMVRLSRPHAFHVMTRLGIEWKRGTLKRKGTRK